MQRSVFGLEGKWEENMVEVGNFSPRLTKTQNTKENDAEENCVWFRGETGGENGGVWQFFSRPTKTQFLQIGKEIRRKSRTAPYCFRKNYPSINVQCLNVIFSCLLCLLFIYLCCLICFSFY